MTSATPEIVRPLMYRLSQRLRLEDVASIGVAYEPFADTESEHGYRTRVAQALQGDGWPVLTQDDAERLRVERPRLSMDSPACDVAAALYVSVILVAQCLEGSAGHGDIVPWLDELLIDLADAATSLSDDITLATALFLQGAAGRVKAPAEREAFEMALRRLALTWALRLVRSVVEQGQERGSAHSHVAALGERMGWRSSASTFLSEPWAALVTFVRDARGSGSQF